MTRPDPPADDSAPDAPDANSAGAPSANAPDDVTRDRPGPDAPRAALPGARAALPGALAPLAGSGALDRLATSARAYARGALADNTRRAYAADWAAWTRWCRRHGADPAPPRPDLVGLYLTHLAAPPRGRPATGTRTGTGTGSSSSGPSTSGLSVASIERRLSGITWGCTRAGHRLDRADRHIATVLAGIRRRHARPPVQKDAVSADDICAMIATLDGDLRGLRDRAMLLVGFAGGLRRSEITGLDRRRDDALAGSGDGAGSGAGSGWTLILPEGLLVTLRGKTGWREVAIGRGAAQATCPVAALETWLRFARIDRGPLFRRICRDGTRALPARLSAQHVALLVKRTAAAAGLRGDLPEAERRALFSGHSLRAGLASHAQADEAHIQKHLGHASAEMTRRYQRNRDRFRVNLTKAAGL